MLFGSEHGCWFDIRYFLCDRLEVSMDVDIRYFLCDRLEMSMDVGLISDIFSVIVWR